MKAPREVRAYVMGKPVVLHNILNSGNVVLEVELDDGRTVQLVVSGDGEIHLRAWGNVPAKIGNMDRTGFSAVVPCEEQTTDPVTYERLTKTPTDD